MTESFQIPAGHSELGGVPRGAEGYVLARAFESEKRDLLFVATSDREMEAVRLNLAFFAPEAEVICLPAWDCLPYDRASPNSAVLAARVVALCKLLIPGGNPRIVLTTVNAALQKLTPRAALQNAFYAIEKSATLRRDAFLYFLAENGYRRSGNAMETGEFAVRGDIIDIIPPGFDEGVRLDTFGDTIESIRTFDPISQLSTGTLENLMLYPASEIILNAATSGRFRTGYREAFGATHNDPLYEAISQGRTSPGMEHWLPLFYERLDTLLDYLPGACLFLAAGADATVSDRLEQTREYYAARKTNEKAKRYADAPYHPLTPDALYLTEDQWERQLEARTVVALSPFMTEVVLAKARTSSFEKDKGPGLRRDDVHFNLSYRQSRNFALGKLTGEALFGDLKAYAGAQREAGHSTIIACYSEGSRERIAHMLHEHGLHPLRIASFLHAKDISGKTIGLATLKIERGFEAENFALLSEQDLLGERIIRSAPPKKKSEYFLAEAANFVPGELVVHKEHGIGRFEGLITLDVSGGQHDCLKIIYDGEAKLFLPVENIDLLSRYGSEEEGTKLDRLGSASWQGRKAKLKERITIMADELLATAAARAEAEAVALTPQTGLYDEFCARFPFAETEDQAKAIDDVLADIASGKPTDRLVCGDVGFGKTEVAMRAAFIAASSHNEKGKLQVAIVCPTTLLCRQHFRTFSQRFAGLPFEIRQISRLTGPKENKKTLEGVANGEIHIVIGTHALLGKSVNFHNLGMLVVDEEQHFGVAQKEKLKSLKADIHVITLSATPIPRTLQLALSGVRELSIIATPPVDRLAVRTFVMPFDPVVIREAILREHHRGGKIFYVTPRIGHMAELSSMLRDLVPEIRVGTAHGQMSPGDLDAVMNAFYDGTYDLLLSTSIVESGLDIPTANTIIINRAEMFGLSQLYQMRGRVGRGKTRAYAYCTLPHAKTLSRAAMRRLEVMQTLDSLGAGFTLASHDMDIRGFGNLLGDEQSGQVREVGIELYQQMLEEAMITAKAKSTGTLAQIADDWSPQINLGMTVLIPEAYVQDLELRLGLYRRAAGLKTEDEIHSFAAELVDRFGPMPQEVDHLLAVVRLKQLCREAGVERIDAGPKGAVLSFRKNSFAKPEKLIAYIAQNARTAKLRPDQKLVLMEEWDDTAAKLKGVRESISKIAELAA